MATEFQIKILKEYPQYKWDRPKTTNDCIPKNNTKFTFSKTQGFVSEYFNPNERPNGLLMWHSVGSGKTLSAVAILAECEKLGYNTLWITRTTLKKDLQKALDMYPLKHTLTVLSYKQFSNVGKSSGEIYRKLLHRAKKLNPNTNDPMYKTIIIIDEAHKLYTKDLKPQEMHDIKSIQNMIYKSYNTSLSNSCKVVIMSATPITENPMEIINLFNLIIQDESNRFNIDTFKNKYIDENGDFTEHGKKLFQNKIKDLVSFIDMSKDPRKFAQIEYKDILVPVSSPDFDMDFVIRTLNCNESYKFCRKDLSIDIADCTEAKRKCKESIAQDKKNLKGTKYQTNLLSEKCNIKI